MTKEELIKNQFPNDEFLQSAVLQIVDKCTAELKNKIADIEANCDLAIEGRNVKIMELEEQIKQMRKELQEIKMSYDNSKDKTPIKAFGAEYRLFCGIENLIEKWEIKEND